MKTPEEIRKGNSYSTLGEKIPQSNQSAWRFLCVFGVFAVKECFRIHRQDAKSAKNFAKQNSFQESKTPNFFWKSVRGSILVPGGSGFRR